MNIHPFFYAFPALMYTKYEMDQFQDGISDEIDQMEDIFSDEIDYLHDRIDSLESNKTTGRIIINGFRHYYRKYHL
jgi:hypothetical protein